MTRPCMCGGCDSCLKDQGVMTDAEMSIRAQAVDNLKSQLDEMDFNDFLSATLDYIAADAFFDLWNSETYYQYKGNHDLAAKYSTMKLNYLRDAYIADNLQAEIERIIKDANEP